MHDVIVVGGGHNGLVAASYLAQANLKALVVEARPIVGGMATCDRPLPEAPAHLMHPCAADLLFMRASTVMTDLRLAEIGFRHIEVDPGYVVLSSEGPSIAFWRDPCRTADEIGRLSRRDAAAYLDLHETLAGAVRLGLPFLAANPRRPGVGRVLRAAHAAWRMRPHLRPMVDLLTTAPIETLMERFEHPIVRDALGTMVGQTGPLDSPSAAGGLIFLPLIQVVGSSRPVGGMGALMAAIVQRLESYGGSVRTNAPVAEILVTGNRARGVRLVSGEEIPARLGVIAACDPRVALGQLVPEGTLPDGLVRRVRRLPASADGCGTVKVDVALSGQLRLTRFEKWRGDGLDLRVPAAFVGTIDDLTRSAHLAAAGILPETLPGGWCIMNAVDTTQAPPGQDSVYFLSDLAPLRTSDSQDEFRKKAGEALIRSVSPYFDEFDSLEIGRRVETAEDMAAKYNVKNGSWFHVDMDMFHFGPLRPTWDLSGYHTPIKGLYLSGAGMHPGPGVGGFAGQIAAREVLRDAKRHARR